MRIMAVAVSEKKIGIAIRDALLLTPQARPTLYRKSLKSDISILGRLAAENEVHEIVIGQPLHMSGQESQQSEKVARFAEELRKALKLPVVFWDERLTSFAAEQHLEEMGLKWRQRRDHMDKIDAMMILQSYLDSRASKNK